MARDGLRTDLPVAVAVLLSWFLVAVDLAHLLTGGLAAVLVVVHLRTRRPGVLHRLSTVRGATAALVVLAAGATLLSGLLRWWDVPREAAGHAFSGYALLGAMAVHLLVVRRAAWARLS